MPGMYIAGWGCALPNRSVTNADLETRMDTNDAWIVERTGIRERRAAEAGTTTATLATDAARAALESAHEAPAAVDLLIVATCTPEQPIPHTGAFVADALGLQCPSFDLNAACSGFVYALVVGASMIGSASMTNVLIVGSETLSRITDPFDRSTAILFGDGAGAALLRSSAGSSALLGFDLGCDGSATEILGQRGGGSRFPATTETLAAGHHFIHMQGQEVFKRAVRAVVDSAGASLIRSALTIDDIDWFVPHQANIRIIESAAQRLGIRMDKTIVNIANVGNTSSASIPMALFEAVDDGRVQPGDRVLLSGFGAGMTWASAIIEWNPS